MRILLAVGLILTTLLTPTGAWPASENLDITVQLAGEEFVGPFANWINAKTGKRFDGTGSSLCTAATGNGSTDDTVALQSCLSALNGTTETVLWLPASTYKITKQLLLGSLVQAGVTAGGVQNISVIGADPATTSIVWGGAGPAVVNASISGTVMTINSVTSGTVSVGQSIYKPGPITVQTITSFGTFNGTSGTVNLSDNAGTVGSQSFPLFGQMLALNGIAYSRIDRLTFDGANLAGIAIDQSYSGAGNYFDTGNEYADDVFKNVTQVGFLCGAEGGGCAETTALRSTFSNVNIGLMTENFNALDWWCWYCTFTNNAVGVSNNALGNGAGNFHVFNGVFQNSSVADISIGNTGIMSFNNNYSSGSNQFINCGASNNPNNLSIEGNTVLDTTSSLAIHCFDLGPTVLIDNVIRSAISATAPAVDSYQDLLSAFNTYTVGTAACGSSAAVNGFDGNGITPRCHSIGDSVVSRGTINPTVPILPGTPPNFGRSIYEVSAGASTATIQAAITNAAFGCANNVAHLQSGSYTITSTLTVPANCPVQIIGDGLGTSIVWGGSGGGVMLQATGPSKLTARDFLLSGASGGATGIVVTNADQPGSRVFVEEGFLALSTTANMLVNGLNYTKVELHDLIDQSSSLYGVDVVGGSSPSGGATNIFAGASSSDVSQFAMSNGGSLSVRQFWHDSGGGGSGGLAALSGTGGAFSIFGMAGYSTGTNPLISLASFSGTSALINISTSGNQAISGTGGSANNLSLGMVSAGPSPSFADTTSPADTYGYLLGQSNFTVTGTVNALTAAGNACLHFAAVPTGVVTGLFIIDNTTGASIPAATTVVSNTCGANNVTMSANAAGAGVGATDSITFQAPAVGAGSSQITESGISTLGFLTTTLAQLRAAQPTVPARLPPGVTDPRFYRVSVQGGIYGIDLEH